MGKNEIQVTGQKINNHSVILSNEYILPTDESELDIKIMFNGDIDLLFTFKNMTNSKENYDNIKNMDCGNDRNIHLDIRYTDDDTKFGLVKKFYKLFSRNYENTETGSIRREQCFFNFILYRETKNSLIFKLQILTKEIKTDD